MISFLAFYSNSSQKECYSQMTQLNLLETSLYIQLKRLSDTYCDFPSGVMVQLQFVNSSLNIGQIFTNFSFNSTDTFTIPCLSCERYDNVQLAQILIDSPQLTTKLNVGSVLNIRKHLNDYEGAVFQILDVRTLCVIIDYADVGKDWKQTNFSLTIYSDVNGIQVYLRSKVEFWTDYTRYCFRGVVVIDYVNHVVLQITGVENGILVSEKFSTKKLLVDQKKIISGLLSTIYSNFFFIGIIPANPAYDLFIETIDTENVTFVAKFSIGFDNHYISGKLNQKLLENYGNIVCDTTDDPIYCKVVMQLVKKQPFLERKSTIFFHFGTEIIVQDVTKWTASCFDGVEIQLRQNEIILSVQYEVATHFMCQLNRKQKVIVDIGIFKSEDDFVDAIGGFTSIQKFEIDWDGNTKILNFSINGSLNEYIRLRNALYKGIFITDLEGEFIDQIQAQRVEIHLQERLIFCIIMCLLISILICVVIMLLHQINRRPRRLTRILTKDDI